LEDPGSLNEKLKKEIDNLQPLIIKEKHNFYKDFHHLYKGEYQNYLPHGKGTIYFIDDVNQVWGKGEFKNG